MSQHSSAADAAAGSVERLLDRLGGVRASGSGWIARCPVHDDRKPSLSVKEGSAGRVLVFCRAGCPTDSIVTAIGMSMVDLFPPGDPHRRRPRLSNGLPIGPNGHPALTSFGDDQVAAMVAELGRLAHVRGNLDGSAADALALIGRCCGTSPASVRLALKAALEGDGVRGGR